LWPFGLCVDTQECDIDLLIMINALHTQIILRVVFWCKDFQPLVCKSEKSVILIWRGIFGERWDDSELFPALLILFVYEEQQKLCVKSEVHITRSIYIYIKRLEITTSRNVFRYLL
jgi:hypothetical protein